MSYDWQEHWKSNEHPFHLTSVNPFLECYWQKLKLPANGHVLVPLCGKSQDLLWLAQQGHQVTGVEISPIACETFFSENRLPFEQQQQDEFIHYDNEKIVLLCGDFFRLDPILVTDISAVYDRAALIALPPALHQRYVKQLTKFMAKGSEMLLIVIDSNDLTQEHPYPLNTADIHNLFCKDFAINEIARVKIDNLSTVLISRGYRTAYEVVYHLKRL